jgi:nucleoside 2-deoxyribosyltransferase
MIIYLAGRYGRRQELAEYAERLRAMGHEVSSRWLLGEHEAKDVNPTKDEAAQWAREDLEDIDRSDMLIAFTEEPGSSYRGGRHVEMGYAIARRLNLFVIGPRENVFYSIWGIKQFNSFDDAFAFLVALQKIERDFIDRMFKKRG